MTACRVCGAEIREGEDMVIVGDDPLHAGCVEAHTEPRRRRIGAWAAYGSRGQMDMGEVQRGAV